MTLHIIDSEISSCSTALAVLTTLLFFMHILQTFVPNYLYDETHRRLNLTAEKFLEAQQNHLEIVVRLADSDYKHVWP